MTRALAVLVPLLGLALPGTLAAQSPCAAGFDEFVGVPEPPFTARLTIHADAITLPEALGRVARAAGVRISFSSNSFDAGRVVCLAYDDAYLGTVLAGLLAGEDVEAHRIAADHVVLTPVPRDDRTSMADAWESRRVVRVPPLLVEVSRRIPAAVTAHTTVIQGSDITGPGGAETLAAALNGVIPGVWLWGDRGPGLVTAFAGIRGRASFRSSAPKVLVDGVELADPSLAIHIAPETIDRIVVLSGPQGAALYGGDAINGVIDIRTRNDVANGGWRPVVRAHSGFGMTTFAEPAGSAVTHRHGVGVTAGDARRWLRLDLAGTMLGTSATTSGARYLAGDVAGRTTGELGHIAASARFLSIGVAAPDRGRVSHPVRYTLTAGGIRRVTAGVEAATVASGWRHTATLGVDAFAVAGEPFSLAPDAGPGIAANAGSKVGFRLTSSRRVPVGPLGFADLIVGADYSVRHAKFDGPDVESSDVETHPPTTSSRDRRPVLANSGVIVRTDVFVDERLTLSGGVRLDYDGTGFLTADRWTAMPAIGAAITTSEQPFQVTIRTSYGRAIRWPDATVGMGSGDRPAHLIPEQQTGAELSVEVRIADDFDATLTVFDQTSSALQPLNAGDDVLSTNSGEIANHGLEFLAKAILGRWSLSGTVSLVDSRVVRSEDGDPLRAGDRMPYVPARTAGLQAHYDAGWWAVQLSASHAADWLAPTSPVATGPAPAEEPAGYTRVRGFARLGAAIGVALDQRLWLVLSGDQRFGGDYGLPLDNSRIGGRDISVGIRMGR